MQHRHLRNTSSVLLITTAFAFFLAEGGCARRTYRVANLPPDLMAPAPLDLDSLNLSNLTEQSISSDVIQPGDVLNISMITDFTKLETTTAPARVADDGTAVVPLVGRVAVSGLEVKQAEQFINTQSIARGIFRNPSITVTMKQCRTCKVTVVGAVNKPGTHVLPRGSTSLMAALLASGGLADDADTEVEIRHTDSRDIARLMSQPQNLPGAPNGLATPVSYEHPAPTLQRVDLLAATNGMTKLPELSDGDVVHVSRRKLQPVHVIGLVQKPDEFEYPPDQELRVLDALALAGGCSNPVAENVLVIRQSPGGGGPVRIKVSIQEAKNGRDNLVLAPGDIVSVEQTAATAAADIIKTFFRVSMGGTLSWF